jgi:hypothetical protein
MTLRFKAASSSRELTGSIVNTNASLSRLLSMSQFSSTGHLVVSTVTSHPASRRYFMAAIESDTDLAVINTVPSDFIIEKAQTSE